MSKPKRKNSYLLPTIIVAPLVLSLLATCGINLRDAQRAERLEKQNAKEYVNDAQLEKSVQNYCRSLGNGTYRLSSDLRAASMAFRSDLYYGGRNFAHESKPYVIDIAMRDTDNNLRSGSCRVTDDFTGMSIFLTPAE